MEYFTRAFHSIRKPISSFCSFAIIFRNRFIVFLDAMHSTERSIVSCNRLNRIISMRLPLHRFISCAILLRTRQQKGKMEYAHLLEFTWVYLGARNDFVNIFAQMLVHCVSSIYRVVHFLNQKIFRAQTQAPIEIIEMSSPNSVCVCNVCKYVSL